SRFDRPIRATSCQAGDTSAQSRFDAAAQPTRPANVSAGRPVRFGYNAPTGHRGFEDLDAATFVGGLQHVLEFVSQHFSSVWLGDHVMTGDRFRVECWTQLTWMAARFERPMLGTLVMATSYRHPPLLAKMAASLQRFSR